MAKEYSVQMDGDRVTSVKVDGVLYTNPDEIPDTRDRKKIKALIARTAEATADGTLEDDFQAELADMQRQSKVFPKVFAAIFFGIAAIMLVIAAFSAVDAAETLSREVSASGKVVDLVEHSSRDSQTGDVTVYIYPVVEFKLPDRPLQRLQMSDGSTSPSNAVGDTVTVLYDPQQRSARIKSLGSDLLMWILPGITFVVGAVFAAVAAVVLKFASPKRSQMLPFERT